MNQRLCRAWLLLDPGSSILDPAVAPVSRLTVPPEGGHGTENEPRFYTGAMFPGPAGLPVLRCRSDDQDHPQVQRNTRQGF